MKIKSFGKELLAEKISSAPRIIISYMLVWRKTYQQPY